MRGKRGQSPFFGSLRPEALFIGQVLSPSTVYSGQTLNSPVSSGTKPTSAQ